MPAAPAATLVPSVVVTDPVFGPGGLRAWVEISEITELVVRRRDGSEMRSTGIARPHRDGSGVVGFVDATRLAVVDGEGRVTLRTLDGDVVRVCDGPGFASALAVAPDGARVAASFDNGEWCGVAVIDLATGTVDVVSDASFAWDPAWSPDGRTVVWVEWDLPAMPWDSSRLMARTGGVRRVVVDGPDAGLSQPRFADDGALGFLRDRRLHWMASLDDAPRAFESDLTIEHGPAPLGPGQRSWGWVGGDVVCGRRNAVVTMTRTGAVTVVQPGHVRAIATAAGEWIGACDDWDTPPYVRGVGDRMPIADAAAHPEWITYEADGVDIPALLWRAPDTGGASEHPYRTPQAPRALLVEVHGGPVGGVAADWRTAQRASYWTSRGWAVLIPAYRGSTGFGDAHRRALRSAWGVADVADVSAGIRHVTAIGVADAERVAVSGGSAGGFTALLVAIQEPALVRAVVSTFGVTDLIACAETTWRFESGFFDWLIGPLPDARDVYVERSPVTHADALRVPLLVFQGTDDVVVTPDQADRLAAAARAAGTPVEDVRFQGEGHGWKRAESTVTELETTDAFLTRYVLDL